MKKIKSALISVFHKDKLDKIVSLLAQYDIDIISTGGSYKYITDLGYKAQTVESLTDYPGILGGRVKTLHPTIFGGILARRDHEQDAQDAQKYAIKDIDLVIVDLYPFEQTIAETNDEATIIEKIDIGGISLIRAAAKNYKDVVIVASQAQYDDLANLLEAKKGYTDIKDRKHFAAQAFQVSSHYDTAIFNYFNRTEHIEAFRRSENESSVLRYGENPHQKGVFYGNLDDTFSQLHGKAISYNNLVDLDAAIKLIKEFDKPTFAILKHTNACGLASDNILLNAWKKALSGDPVSAFGGVLASNTKIDVETAQEINKLFFEIIIAPDYEADALKTLQSKKNRIILKAKDYDFGNQQFKSVLNGVLVQDNDIRTEIATDCEARTNRVPNAQEMDDLLFANKIVKHTKSNAIVLVKDEQLVGSGTGQTSRVDALKQAIVKAKVFNLPLQGAVMASDAFFPFSDSVEIANKEGINAVIQPGGSVRDQDSIDFCNKTDMAMVFTGTRHFKH